MDNLKTFKEILDVAIEREQAAADFYNDLAERVALPAMADVFRGFAREELGHKSRLQHIKADPARVSVREQVLDLKMSDYIVPAPISDHMSYEDALVLAMKRENAAFRLYSDLATAQSDPELRTLFLALAREEAKHKLRFEVEYDDNVLTEN